jgi:hypothetical protein
MEYKEFLDYVLGVYYFTKKADPKFSITPFWPIEMMDSGYTSRDVIEIMNTLGAEGYLLHYYQKGGSVSSITPKGISHFENFDEDKKEQIEEFLEDKGIMKIIDKWEKVRDPIEFEKKKIKKIANSIKKELEEEDGLDNDLLIDINSIKLELTKRKPDTEILKMKIENLVEENIAVEKLRELKERLSF